MGTQTTDHRVAVNQADTVPRDPRQFRIVDLIALMTLAALASALAAPFIRALSPDHRSKLIITTIVQLIVMATTIATNAKTRTQVLRQAGEKLGTGYLGALRWSRLTCVLGMLFLGAIQLFLSFVFLDTSNRNTRVPDNLLFHVQLAYSSAAAISRYRWGAYPNMVEIFQNGLVFSGTRFVNWTQAEPRPCVHQSDRVTIVFRHSPQSAAGETKTVQMSDALRDWILTKDTGEESPVTNSP
jgi:hypothetical protein